MRFSKEADYVYQEQKKISDCNQYYNDRAHGDHSDSISVIVICIPDCQSEYYRRWIFPDSRRIQSGRICIYMDAESADIQSLWGDDSGDSDRRADRIVYDHAIWLCIVQTAVPRKKFFSFYLFFTMLFNGGLVPTYILYTRTLHVKNTIWGLILPGLLMGAFNVILVRSFIQSTVPEALVEAAESTVPDSSRRFLRLYFRSLSRL